MKYRIIDTHCHPQFPQFDTDRERVIQDSLTKGIGMVCVGTDLVTSREAIELATQYEGLYASVGLHPNDEVDVHQNIAEYEKLAAHPKVVAIGEIGLDYYRTSSPEHRRMQKERFIAQLAMARRLSLPAILHCRDATKKGADEASAYTDMLDVLRHEAQGLKAVLHSFNGSVAQARTYLDEGFYIGLNAIVTFAREYSDMVCSLPDNRILLETDAPYLAPAPHRGKRNEPAFVEAVGNHVAALRGSAPEKLFEITTANTHQLFSKLE